MHNINQITIKFYNTMLEKADRYVYRQWQNKKEYPSLSKFRKRFKINTAEAMEVINRSKGLILLRDEDKIAQDWTVIHSMNKVLKKKKYGS